MIQCISWTSSHSGEKSSCSPFAMWSESELCSWSRVFKLPSKASTALSRSEWSMPSRLGENRIRVSYKKIKRCKAIRTMMVAKYLHCCFVFIVVFFQVHRQGSDSGTFLKNRIHKLAKDFFGPACLTCLIMILIFQSKMFESICLDCFAIQLALGSKYAT